MEERTRDALNTFARTRSLLNEDLQALADRIGSVNGAVESMLNGSAQTLTSMGEVLERKMSQFGASVQLLSNETASTSKALEDQLQALSGISTDVLSSIVDLSDRFDVHGRALSGASQAIMRTTERLEESVGTQLSNLGTVSDGIADRTDRAEQALQLTSERLASTLMDAEERSAALASALSLAADDAAKGVIAQFSTLRETASSESIRATDAVRQAQEDIIRELRSGLENAMSSFQEAAGDMRKMTGDLNAELNTTRSDIRRGVFELPEEARESAAALRQVVNEQVSALKELASLVSSEGNASDASVRGIAPAPVAPAPAAPAPPRRAMGSAAPAALSAEATAIDAGTSADIVRSMENVRQAVAPAATSPAAAEDAPSGGWISDLLRRASSDDADGPLSAIRDQLADAIDERTYAQQWDSYLAGNKVSFSRRLFTLSGQDAFDDIRRQLGRDTELRKAAQDHLTTFEATLRDMAARRASRSETRDLLMSDDGRLYTVVGQALGRFGS